MSKAGALNLASGLGGKIDKSDVLSAVENLKFDFSAGVIYRNFLEILMRYEKYHVCYGGDEEERKANYTDMVNKYYDLVTSFYEFGWGESFHFAPRFKEESLRESIKRHEHFLALQLGLKPGQKGCGIGGPLREIARFSSTTITGLNNNEYQISRGKELNRITGVDRTCDFVKGDFMKMPFPDNVFDAVYAIEATCHAPDAYGCYSEIYRVLKPGQCFAAYEWCMTDSFDPLNQEHQKIKAEIEIGDGLPDIRLTGQCIDALKKAGFEVMWSKDLAVGSPLPWYLPLDKTHFSLSSFRFNSCREILYKKHGQSPGICGRKEIFTPLSFSLWLGSHIQGASDLFSVTTTSLLNFDRIMLLVPESYAAMGLLSLFSSLLFFSSTILNVGSRQPAEDIFGLKRFCKYIQCDELDTSWGAIPFERYIFLVTTKLFSVAGHARWGVFYVTLQSSSHRNFGFSSKLPMAAAYYNSTIKGAVT
ncbi:METHYLTRANSFERASE [Salix viminalis]|uniref:sterol 24-C-methyltransferase n=3 Tax=Salix TaxID=40685 RepID=A0A9Q0NJN7_SALVM|nr:METHYLTRANSFERASE [Salix viminalis]